MSQTEQNGPDLPEGYFFNSTPVTTAPSSEKNSTIGENANLSIDAANEFTGLKLILVHTTICICTFLLGLAFNNIATAVLVITSKFGSIEHVGWYGASSYMTLCALQPLASKAYKLFPRKVIYLCYLLIFELGSLVCVLAPSSRALIAGRAVAGFGGSGVFAGGFVIIATIIPSHKRAIYTGIMTSTFTIARIISPVLGGSLVQHVSWRWCFYINLPIDAFAVLIFVIVFQVKLVSMEGVHLTAKLEGLDTVGFALFASAITMLLLALEWEGVQHRWNSSVVVGLLVGFGIVFLIFMAWQAYPKDDALIPPRVFYKRNTWLICASSFFVTGSFQTVVYWLPVWFQAVLGATPTQSGVQYFLTAIADVLAYFIGTGIVMKLGIWNPFLMFGDIMVCIGGGLLTTFYPGIVDVKWIGYQSFDDIGFSLTSNMAHLGICAIFLAIAQAVFENRLNKNVSQFAGPRVVQDITTGGATNLRDNINASDMGAVLLAYNDSRAQVFFIAATAPKVSFALAACCKWTPLKTSENSALAKGAEKALQV